MAPSQENQTADSHFYSALALAGLAIQLNGLVVFALISENLGAKDVVVVVGRLPSDLNSDRQRQ